MQSPQARGRLTNHALYYKIPWFILHTLIDSDLIWKRNLSPIDIEKRIKHKIRLELLNQFSIAAPNSAPFADMCPSIKSKYVGSQSFACPQEDNELKNVGKRVSG